MKRINSIWIVGALIFLFLIGAGLNNGFFGENIGVPLLWMLINLTPISAMLIYVFIKNRRLDTRRKKLLTWLLVFYLIACFLSTQGGNFYNSYDVTFAEGALKGLKNSLYLLLPIQVWFITVLLKSTKSLNQKGSTKESEKSVYFSYAWKDENNQNREDLVEALYAELQTNEFPVKRDKEDCEFGEYIDEFMKDIGQGDIILVFISNKYLKSLYCMVELFLIAQKSGWDKFDFKDRIIPVVVEPINFDDQLESELLDYWQKVEKEKIAHKNNKAPQMRATAISGLDRVIDASRKISDLYTWLRNLNRGSIELYQKNDFEAIKKKIEKRFTGIDAL